MPMCIKYMRDRKSKICSKDNFKNEKNVHFKPDLGYHNNARALLIIMKICLFDDQVFINYDEKNNLKCMLFRGGGPKIISFPYNLCHDESLHMF